MAKSKTSEEAKAVENKDSVDEKSAKAKSAEETKTAVQKLAEQSGEFKELFDALTIAVTAGAALLEAAKPLVESVDYKGIQAKVQTTTNKVSAGAKTMKAGVVNVSSAIGGKAGEINAAREKILADMANAKDEKALRKAVREARQAVLANPTTSMALKDFLASVRSDAAVNAYAMPGCYVIATYKKFDFDKDLTDYTGIYVGKADSIGDSVFEVISNRGNPDVYADYKYKQNMQIYVFNCLPEDLDERFGSLKQLFNCAELYNVD